MGLRAHEVFLVELFLARFHRNQLARRKRLLEMAGFMMELQVMECMQ